MQELETNELKKIEGGFDIGIGGLTIISLGVPFIIGFFEGLTTPLTINN